MAAVLKVLVAALALTLSVATGASAQQPPQPSNDIVLEQLESQDLVPGRCGLFLWLRSAQPLFVMVAYANPSEARVRTAGRNRYLRRVSFGKEQIYGHFERQTFTDGRLTFEVDLEFDTQRQVRSGAVVKQGVIRVRDEDKWESVHPVGGLVVCKDTE
jgi:hypothetical protein